MSSLTDRIALILQAEASSEAIAAIIDDAQTELLDVKDACTAAQRQVLDPFLGTAAVARARKEHDELSLAASRLEDAIERLADQLEVARAREAEAAKRKRYDEALTERDALVEDLKAIYPEAAATIAALLLRIEAADGKIAAVNTNLPDGAVWLEYPEQIARGRPPHEGGSLSRSVRLPGLPHPSSEWNSIWPVARTFQ